MRDQTFPLLLPRSTIDQIGVSFPANWMEIPDLKTDEELVILKLNIEATSYDFLHRRALEVFQTSLVKAA
jgi:hypothetical protein